MNIHRHDKKTKFNTYVKFELFKFIDLSSYVFRTDFRNTTREPVHSFM